MKIKKSLENMEGNCMGSVKAGKDSLNHTHIHLLASHLWKRLQILEQEGNIYVLCSFYRTATKCQINQSKIQGHKSYPNSCTTAGTMKSQGKEDLDGTI